MRYFVRRRLVNATIVVLLVAALVAVAGILSISMSPVDYFSGWILLALVLALTAYNLRKRIPYLPLGNSATWLQIHVYTGIVSGAVFLIHIGGRIPNGWFEQLLGGTFAIVFLSGVVGLVMTRTFPARLATRGEEVLFERIPTFRRKIREEVEELIVDYTATTDASAVPEFYLQRIKPFFDGGRNFVFHLLHSERPLQKLLLDIRSQEQFLNDQERELMTRVVQRVHVKDDLDYQFALQATLKYWLFVHIPLTYGLLVFAGFHVLLIQRYSERLW